jgi:multiple sugar transport system substrate-binding protein
MRVVLPVSGVLRLAAILILAGGATGCSLPARSGGPVEVRYWTGWTGKELDAQKRLVEEFNQTHPGLRVRVLSVAGSYQKVRIAFAGAATPDVCSAVWADELAGYAMRGVLTPLDPYLARSGRSLEEYVPGVARMLRYRGQTFGLAVTTNTNFLVYNKRIFREAGLDPERPPRTIAELDAAAAACTQYAPGGSFVRYGFRPTGLPVWAYVFGGRWYDPETGEVTANDPRNVAALRWMASYGDRYDVTRMQNFEAGFGNYNTANGPFFVGKIAMWQAGEWARRHINRHAPDMEWGWFPLPATPGGRPWTSGAGGSVFVIPAATKHPEAAWEFLDYLTRPYAVGEFCTTISNLPPLRDVGQEARFQQDPVFRFGFRLASGENVFGPPQMPVWPRYLQEIRRAEDYAIFGRRDPQQLLDEVDARMERDLARTLREAL